MKTPTTTSKPVPTQAAADEIREEAVTDAAENDVERSRKAKAKPAKPDVPYPSQADLDAMKEGRFGNREVTSEQADAIYKTR